MSQGRFPEKKRFWEQLACHFGDVETQGMKTSARGGVAGRDLAYSHMHSHQLSYPSSISLSQMLTLLFR
jgi:hypothetical protein